MGSSARISTRSICRSISGSRLSGRYALTPSADADSVDAPRRHASAIAKFNALIRDVTIMNELLLLLRTPRSTRYHAFDGQALYDGPGGSYDGAARAVSCADMMGYVGRAPGCALPAQAWGCRQWRRAHDRHPLGALELRELELQDDEFILDC